MADNLGPVPIDDLVTEEVNLPSQEFTPNEDVSGGGLTDILNSGVSSIGKWFDVPENVQMFSKVASTFGSHMLRGDAPGAIASVGEEFARTGENRAFGEMLKRATDLGIDPSQPGAQVQTDGRKVTLSLDPDIVPPTVDQAAAATGDQVNDATIRDTIPGQAAEGDLTDPDVRARLEASRRATVVGDPDVVADGTPTPTAPVVAPVPPAQPAFDSRSLAAVQAISGPGEVEIPDVPRPDTSFLPTSFAGFSGLTPERAMSLFNARQNAQFKQYNAALQRANAIVAMRKDNRPEFIRNVEYALQIPDDNLRAAMLRKLGVSDKRTAAQLNYDATVADALNRGISIDQVPSMFQFIQGGSSYANWWEEFSRGNTDKNFTEWNKEQKAAGATSITIDPRTRAFEATTGKTLAEQATYGSSLEAAEDAQKAVIKASTYNSIRVKSFSQDAAIRAEGKQELEQLRIDTMTGLLSDNIGGAKVNFYSAEQMAAAGLSNAAGWYKASDGGLVREYNP